MQTPLSAREMPPAPARCEHKKMRSNLSIIAGSSLCITFSFMYVSTASRQRIASSTLVCNPFATPKTSESFRYPSCTYSRVAVMLDFSIAWIHLLLNLFTGNCAKALNNEFDKLRRTFERLSKSSMAINKYASSPRPPLQDFTNEIIDSASCPCSSELPSLARCSHCVSVMDGSSVLMLSILRHIWVAEARLWAP